MFVRYHLFYYMLGMLCLVMGIYFHWLFLFIAIFYLIWLYQRLSLYHVCICFIVCLPILWWNNVQEYPQDSIIQGTVQKTMDTYSYVKTQYGLMKLYHDEPLSYRDEIKVSVEYLQWNENTNDNAFNEKLYNFSQKVWIKGKIKDIEYIKSNKGLYHWIESQFSFNQDVESYQRLLLLGQKDEGIQDEYKQLSNFSLIHLFALSGMHIHILYGLLYSIIGVVISKQYAKWISFVLIGLYVFSIPVQISLYRAFFTLVLYELAKRYFNHLDVLSFLIIISLYNNPYIIYNTSFVFSYFVYFIVLITKDFRFSYFWIFLSTVPIVLNLNYQIPILSLWVGLFLMPFIEIFYSLCILSVLFPLLEMLLIQCVYVFQNIISFLEAVQIFFTLSKPTLSFFAMFYVLYFYIIYQKSLSKTYKKQMLALISLCIAFFVYGRYKIYGEITMIDVGQGDCVLLRQPYNKGNILIDTGGHTEYDIAKQTIIPYLKSIGVDKLDCVYISHDDLDHCGALESLVKNFKVKQVIRDFEAYRKIGDIEIEMLEHTYSKDINDQSLVMYIHLPGLNMLTLGDASINVEKELLDKYKKLDVDILKVSHHGSRTSSGVDLFQMIQPQYAMIGVKKNNLYRHPSLEVIERLKRKNIKILRTDEDGMFHIRYYGSKCVVYR